jgi:hypothetical protein
VVMMYITCYFSGENEENHKILQSGCPVGRDLNLGSPILEAGVLPTQP